MSRKSSYDKAAFLPSTKLGRKVYVLKLVKEGPLFKVSPKFEGPYRVVELLKFNKHRLRDINSGNERVVPWNHMKLIREDIDTSFVKKESKCY